MYANIAQCDRRYPCNHCTRRRQPEDCIYHPSQASQAPQTDNRPPEDTAADHDVHLQDTSGNDEPVGVSSDDSTRRRWTVAPESNSLAELFAYVEHSESNTMALVRRVSDLPIGF
jgi:hypothetical protein